MTQTFSSPQVICRPAIARDHADIAEFCKGIWEGGDYVPEVWTHWYNDPNGILVTAEYNGYAIGCAKLSLIDDGQWWLEGVRVDPHHQGLKVGSRMHTYLTDWWVEHGNGTVRLLTENPAMVHLCEKTDYTKTQELRGYSAISINEPTDNFSPATPHLSSPASLCNSQITSLISAGVSAHPMNTFSKNTPATKRTSSTRFIGGRTNKVYSAPGRIKKMTNGSWYLVSLPAL